LVSVRRLKPPHADLVDTLSVNMCILVNFISSINLFLSKIFSVWH